MILSFTIKLLRRFILSIFSYCSWQVIAIKFYSWLSLTLNLIIFFLILSFLL